MQQPPYQPYQPVPPPPLYVPIPVTPLKKPKRSRWFLGCGLLVVMLAVCGLCGIITNTSSNQTNTSADTSNADPTPTATGSHMVVIMTIHSPTAVIARSTNPTNVRPTDTPKPVQPPMPTIAPFEPTQSAVHTGVNGNPWGYDFTPGTYITSAPVDFCSVFDCIKNFPHGIGYVVECNDGMYSKSGGRPGSCSRNGGEAQILYAH